MLYIRSPTIYSLYIPIICGFISISELAFSLPVPTINFEDHTLHLASRLSSMERDAQAAMVNGGEEWLPCGKNIWQTNKGDNNYWTSRLIFFFETFFQCSFFGGWRIFESIKWYLVSVFLHSRIQRWLFRSLVYSDDVRHNWRPYNPWSRNTRSRFLLDHGREVQMVGDGNPWRFMTSFCEWENLEFFFKHLDVEAFSFLEVVFLDTIWWCAFFVNSSNFWGSWNFA